MQARISLTAHQASFRRISIFPASIHRASIVAISIALGILIAELPAHAQDAKAAVLFEDGIKLMAAGKLAQACEAFEASNLIDPRAGTLIHLGECRERNQQIASAWSAYNDALNRAKDSRKREVAAAKAAALEPRLSYLTVSVSDENRVEGLDLTRNGKRFDAASWNQPLPVDGGDYVVVGHAPGRKEWQISVNVAVEGARINIPVPKLEEVHVATLGPPPSALPLGKLPLTEPRDRRPNRAQGGFTVKRKISVAVAGAAVVSAATGAVLGMRANDKESEAGRLCPKPPTPCTLANEANALIQSNHNLTFEANVAFGVAAAAAIGASVLWLTGAPDAENTTRISIVPNLDSGVPNVVITRRF